MEICFVSAVGALSAVRSPTNFPQFNKFSVISEGVAIENKVIKRRAFTIQKSAFIAGSKIIFNHTAPLKARFECLNTVSNESQKLVGESEEQQSSSTNETFEQAEEVQRYGETLNMSFALPLLPLIFAEQTSSVGKSLEPIAEYFNKLNLPPELTKWGHPVMMSIVVLAMGGTATWAGWKLKDAKGKERATLSELHTSLAPAMFMLLAIGGTGGALSTVMQGKPLFESGHFVTGMIALAGLTVNSVLAGTFRGKGGAERRTYHAYVGTATMAILIIHMLLGFQLGFSF